MGVLLDSGPDVFTFLSTPDTSLNMTWCYNERHHGKDLMDGIGRTLKNSIYWDVMSGKCVNDIPKQFAQFAESAVKRITSLYLPTEEILKEPDDIRNSPRITDALQIHKVKRCFDNRKKCFLELYNLGTNNEPFFTQFYGRGACGHQNNALGGNHCGLCGKEYMSNEEWLQCPICKVWFDRECFYL